MSRTVEAHRAESPQRVRCAVITISDTRTLATDRGGDTLVALLEAGLPESGVQGAVSLAGGHEVVERHLVPDEPERIEALLRRFSEESLVEAVLLTGGTGVGSRDQTFETVVSLLSKTLPGYGELFRLLSYEEIGAAAMLSRAVGGLFGKMVVLTMPGSPAAVRLAMEKLILPELGHLVREARR